MNINDDPEIENAERTASVEIKPHLDGCVCIGCRTDKRTEAEIRRDRSRDVLNECGTCEGANGQHSVNCLAVVAQFYAYTCGVCGKHSTIPKDGSVGKAQLVDSPYHFSGCVRIGMPTYW